MSSDIKEGIEDFEVKFVLIIVIFLLKQLNQLGNCSMQSDISDFLLVLLFLVRVLFVDLSNYRLKSK
jgi:hypothetical protein